MPMKKFILIFILIICALALGACKQAATDNPNSVGIGEASEVETVYIGALLPLSNENETARDMQTAMELAADIINNHHDIDWDLAQNAGLADYGDARVEVVLKDCGSTNKTATTATNDLIKLGVPIIVGAYSSELTAAVALACYRNDIPLICGSAKSAALTDSTNLYAPSFNRIATTDSLETALFLDYINQLNLTTKAGIKKVAIAYIDNDYGVHATEILKAGLDKTNLEIVALISYDPGETDLADEASKMIISEPDVLFHISSTDDLISFAKFYAQANYQPKLALCFSGGFQTSSFAEYVKEAGLDFYMGTMVCPDLYYKNPETAENTENASAKNSAALNGAAQREKATELFTYINTLYRERRGKNISNAALLEFASVIVAAQAVAMAGTTDKETVAVLLKENTFPAPYLYSGSIAFDKNGQNKVMPAYIAAIIDGRYSYVY